MTEKARSKRVSRDYLVGILTGVTFSALLGLFIHPNEAATVSLDDAPVESADSIPNICPKDDIENSRGLDQPEIQFALDELSFEMYSGLIGRAQTPDESQGYLNQIFDKWGYNVHIAEVPTLSSNDFETRGSDVEHSPELITQDLINVSAIHILQSLANIPNSIMELTHGTELYLTMGMTGEAGGYAGLYAKDEHDKPLMIVGIGPDDASGEIFEHELAHNLFFRLCGDNIGYNDRELAALNPSDFYYTRRDVPDSFWQNITSSRYGAYNSTEDTAEMFPELFYVPLGRLCLRNESTGEFESTICTKQELLLQRIAAVNPDAAAYLARN